MSYETDRELAKERRVPFKVCTKSAQGRPWEEVENDLEDLQDAMILANHLDGHYQVGVLAVREGCGYIYWTSKTPDLFHSPAIEMDIGGESESAV